MFVFHAGYAEMMTNVFPPVYGMRESPNFTGYDFDNIDWNEKYQAMAQPPNEAIIDASTL